MKYVGIDRCPGYWGGLLPWLVAINEDPSVNHGGGGRRLRHAPRRSTSESNDIDGWNRKKKILTEGRIGGGKYQAIDKENRDEFPLLFKARDRMVKKKTDPLERFIMQKAKN